MNVQLDADEAARAAVCIATQHRNRATWPCVHQGRGHVYHRRFALVAVVEPQPLGVARSVHEGLMGHDRRMSRLLLVTLVILVFGLMPDQLSGHGPSRLRASLMSNLFNRSDLERIERGYYEQLIDACRRLDDLADVPGLHCVAARAIPGRSRSTTHPWSCVSTTSAKWP